MCGLFGAFTTSSLTNNEIKNVNTLGYLSYFRGIHSTGIGLVNLTKGKYFAKYRKKADPAGVFLHDEDTIKLIKSVQNPKLYLGHTRHATFGKLDDENAHPFCYGNIIGTHNGVLEAFEIKGDDRSDSSYFFEMLANEGYKAALEKAHTRAKCAYALVWIDINEGRMYLIRNDDRSLFCMSNKAGTTTYYASEYGFLRFMSNRNPLNSFGEICHFEPDTLYTRRLWEKDWKTEKLEYPKIVPFTTRFSKQHDPYSYTDNKKNKTVRSEYAGMSKKEKKKRKKQENLHEEGYTNIILLSSPTTKKEELSKNIDLTKHFYIGYAEIRQPVEAVVKKLQKGCSFCGAKPFISSPIYWRNFSSFVCEECYDSDELHMIDEGGKFKYNSMYALGKFDPIVA